MSFAGGVIWVCAAIVCEASTGGFVRAGLLICMRMKRQTITISIHLITFQGVFIFVFDASRDSLRSRQPFA